MVEESEAEKISGTYDLVLTMAQEEKTLKILDSALADSVVWNSQAAIRNCYRKTMSQLLLNLAVGYVPYQLLPTDGSLAPDLEAGSSYWLKRSDFHAIADEDVTLAESAEEVLAKMARFHTRGVKEVILQRHVHGDIYKFYGVKDRFFLPIKVRSFLTNSPTSSLELLESMATRSAEALGLKIYGGDAILDQEGNFHLIDLNDWPSFRLCRAEAAHAIADLCLSHLLPLASRREPLRSSTLSLA
jgi:hypothetical protein